MRCGSMRPAMRMGRSLEIWPLPVLPSSSAPKSPGIESTIRPLPVEKLIASARSTRSIDTSMSPLPLLALTGPLDVVTRTSPLPVDASTAPFAPSTVTAPFPVLAFTRPVVLVTCTRPLPVLASTALPAPLIVTSPLPVPASTSTPAGMRTVKLARARLRRSSRDR